MTCRVPSVLVAVFPGFDGSLLNPMPIGSFMIWRTAAGALLTSRIVTLHAEHARQSTTYAVRSQPRNLDGPRFSIPLG